MVVFTCNHCGESLQKPRVEKHYYTTCRHNPKSLTCVDCLKDFRLEEYAAHTQCMTETERYAAKGTVIAVPKGKKKQESWVDTVHNVLNQEISNARGNIKNIFDILLVSNNIPKKQKPFTNFILSSMGNRINQKDIETVWNIIVSKTKNNNTEQKTDESKDIKNNENDSKENQTIGEADKTKDEQQENDNSKNEMNGEINKSKKSKKNKKKSKEVETNGNNDLEKVEENDNTVTENQTNGETIESKKSKKNKKKSKEIETNGINNENLQGNETINKEESETTINKSKKKKKKSKDSNEEITNEPMDIQENNNETEQVKENSKQKKKRKSEKENVETNKTEEVSPTKKIKTDETDLGMTWENIIIEILKKKSDGITKEKLENKFLKKLGKEASENNVKLIKRFNKKLQNLENVSFDDNIVKLVV